MNARFVLHRLELNFWHVTIPILRTSPTLRYIVPRVYTFVQSKIFNQVIVPTMIYAALGLSLGFVFGVFYFFR